MAIKLKTGLPVIAALGMLASMQVDANALTFTGTSGTRSAQVDLTTDGLGNLFVQLTNISLSDVLVPTDVLTGIFWTGTAVLTPVSAVLAAGSSVFMGTTENAPAGGNVGGEWAYKAGIDGPGNSTVGISSSGLGLFGPPDLFGGTNLEGPDSPDGLQYGILSAGDNHATGNAAILGSSLIDNSVIFTFSGLAPSFNLASIGNVVFQYGTALTEPSVEGRSVVPVPAALPLLASGLMGLVALGRMRRKKAANQF